MCVRACVCGLQLFAPAGLFYSHRSILHRFLAGNSRHRQLSPSLPPPRRFGFHFFSVGLLEIGPSAASAVLHSQRLRKNDSVGHVLRWWHMFAFNQQGPFVAVWIMSVPLPETKADVARCCHKIAKPPQAASVQVYEARNLDPGGLSLLLQTVLSFAWLQSFPNLREILVIFEDKAFSRLWPVLMSR